MIRPGPGDKTDRFPYWPVRLNEGGKVMIPGKIDDPVQFADVRDVAQWMIRLDSKRGGLLTQLGPPLRMTMPVFVYGAHAAFSSAVELTVKDMITTCHGYQGIGVHTGDNWLWQGKHFQTRIKNGLRTLAEQIPLCGMCTNGGYLGS